MRAYAKGLESKKVVGIVVAILASCLILANINLIWGTNTGTISSQKSLFSTSFESGVPCSEVSYCETSPPPSYPQDEYVHGEITGSQEQSHTGLWSARCYSVDGGPAGRCRLNFVVEPTKVLYARAYFYIETWDGYIQVLRFWSDHPEDQQESGAGDYVAMITINGGSITLQLGKSGVQYERVSSRSFATGGWYSIEMMMYIHQSDGEFRVWVDDEEITDLTFRGDTYTDWSHWITEARAGVVLYQQNVNPAIIFVDDYAVAPTRIGVVTAQGNLIIAGDDVFVIEGIQFDINGSMFVEENATLILKNAIINFTLSGAIFLQNPVNGNPRLHGENTTIVNAGYSRFYGNSSSIFSNCTMLGGGVFYYEESAGTVFDSTFNYIQARDSSTLYLYKSTVENLDLVTESANSSIANLTPGLFKFWNFWLNCSVTANLFGTAPNATLIETSVQSWSISFQGSSDAEIRKADIFHLHANSYAHVSVSNSTIYSLESYHSAVCKLTNSTYSMLRLYHQAALYVYWYLDVQVVDEIGNYVSSANVAATYLNTTLAESKLTDGRGWTRLTLMEKMMNATNSYPIGNYTVTATHGVHLGQESVNMTANKETAIQLPFIIREFSSLFILPLFMLASLLAAVAYRRKRISRLK